MAKGLKNADTKRYVDWSNLPSDILDIVLDKLFHISDYARTGAACKSWKSVAVNYQQQKRIAAMHEQPPMLLFINSADFNSSGFFKLSSPSILFNIGEDRLYESGFRFDQWISNHNVTCLGSSYGWLVLQISTSQIMLLNPFIRKVIEIPWIPFRQVLKIVMSCDPSKLPDELVIAALTGTHEIALITPGQQRWTIVDELYFGMENNKGDIFFHKGLLYVMSSGYTIIAIDSKHPQTDDIDRHVPNYARRRNARRRDVRHRVFNVDAFHCENYELFNSNRVFLVEACNGDLLLVLCRLPSYPRDPWKFNVYKLEFLKGEEGYIWRGTEMEKSTDDAIFLSDNSCLCIPAAASGTNPNSIYFSFNCRDTRYPDHFRFCLRQTGIYNLEDCTLRDLPGLPRVLEGKVSPMVPIALLSPCIGQATATRE